MDPARVTTALLLPGHMCDARLWTARVRAVLTARGLAVRDIALTQADTIEAMADRSLAGVEGRVLPVGFSMGAIVALAIAQAAPERMAGAVLIGLNAGADLPERSAARVSQQAEVRAGGLRRVLVEELKPHYLARRHRDDAALLALLRDMGETLGPDIFVQQSEGLRTRADRRGVLATMRCPVLLACGAEDALCPPAWHAEWARRAPAAELTVIEGAGHMLPLEDDAALADRLDAWLLNKEIA